MKAPTAQQCSDNQDLAGTDTKYVFATWHPQWGGYVGKCVVAFDTTTECSDGGPGCFTVSNWHDGEFPHDDEPPMELHYCDATQLIGFGLTVLEKQCKQQLDHEGGTNVKVDQNWLQSLIIRLEALQ